MIQHAIERQNCKSPRSEGHNCCDESSSWVEMFDFYFSFGRPMLSSPPPTPCSNTTVRLGLFDSACRGARNPPFFCPVESRVESPCGENEQSARATPTSNSARFHERQTWKPNSHRVHHRPFEQEAVLNATAVQSLLPVMSLIFPWGRRGGSGGRGSGGGGGVWAGGGGGG